MYSIMLSEQVTVVLLPFGFGRPPSCITALTRTANMSKVLKVDILAFFLRGKAFSFVPLNTMLAVGLSYKACIMLRYVSSIEKFYDKWRTEAGGSLHVLDIHTEAYL